MADSFIANAVLVDGNLVLIREYFTKGEDIIVDYDVNFAGKVGEVSHDLFSWRMDD